jgi:hypothetical protein
MNFAATNPLSSAPLPYPSPLSRGRGRPDEAFRVRVRCGKSYRAIPLLLLSATLALLIPSTSSAQDTGKEAEKKPANPSSSTEKPIPSPAELEATFKTTMTRATLTGRWCGIRNGQLGPEKEDKYTILDVTKLGGDVWLVKTRIQYGKTDVVAPIPVRVKWAGDTPVITVDGVSMPGGGPAYSARVLIYGKTYAGTWSGGDHAGLMSGVITNEKEEKPASP